MFMSNNLKEWMLYIDIILLSAWFGYGGKKIYNGGTLSFGYLALGFLILSGIITIFYLKKDESFLKIMSFEEEE